MKDHSEINTEFFERCCHTLKRAWELLSSCKTESIEYDMYRSACVKEFEIILEQSGKLLRKCLKPYFHSARAVDALTFKDVFRHAAKHGLLTLEASERWMAYRDNRNNTAHDYGKQFAEVTMKLLPDFIADIASLKNIFEHTTHD